MDKPGMVSDERPIQTSLLGRAISVLSSLAHALFWVQSFPSGSPHVATHSITVPGLSRGFACATRVPAPRLDAAPVNSRCGRANQSAVVMVTRP